MLPAVSVFLLAFIYFYPLTLRFCYRGQKAELQWLPRLCGGFARPQGLNAGRNANQSKALSLAKRLLGNRRRRSLLPLLRWLPGHMRLESLHWLFMLAPAARYGFTASVECILSMRCGDIITGIIYGIWLCRKQKTDVRR